MGKEGGGRTGKQCASKVHPVGTRRDVLSARNAKRSAVVFAVASSKHIRYRSRSDANVNQRLERNVGKTCIFRERTRFIPAMSRRLKKLNVPVIGMIFGIGVIF